MAFTLNLNHNVKQSELNVLNNLIEDSVAQLYHQATDPFDCFPPSVHMNKISLLSFGL